MEVNNVINKLVIFCAMLISHTSFCQNPKYLLFDNDKDTIIKIGNIKYYKIDNNLFNINRYNQVDTINKINKVEFNMIEGLWKKGKVISDSILKVGIQQKKIKIIETNNEIFEYIYILEKTNNCSYKRTRVWWIDY